MLDYKLLPNLEDVEGHVTLKVPSATERLKIAKESGIGSSGNEEDSLDSAIKIMELVQNYIKEVDIKKGEIECKDFESLSYYDFGMEIINKSAAILVGGIPTGKN